MLRNFYILLLLALFAAASCDKEDRKNTYADQETRIDNYVSTLSSDYTVVYNRGVPRIIVAEGISGGNVLKKGDSLYFHFSGYVFSSGKGSLFATNDASVAEANGFTTDGQPYMAQFGKSPLIKGLELGLEGAKEGEHCYIIFSARYGYGNQIMASIPKLTPLFFDITIDKVF